MPCLQQIVDLQQSEGFRGLDVALVSIAQDPVNAWAAETQELGIDTPVLSDPSNRVASRYGVTRWAMPSGEPGHTFVLVDDGGVVRWVRDYGAPEHGGLMYVAPSDLLPEIEPHLGR
jgi:peroxiredoxin